MAKYAPSSNGILERILTFQEFQQSGSDIADLRVTGFCDHFDDTKPGRIYEGGFYVEREPNGQWSMTIGNASWCGEPLETLERELYDYAAGEMGWATVDGSAQ